MVPRTKYSKQVNYSITRYLSVMQLSNPELHLTHIHACACIYTHVIRIYKVQQFPLFLLLGFRALQDQIRSLNSRDYRL